MQILLSNKFVTFEYYSEKSSIHYQWNYESKYIDWIDYKHIMENFRLLLLQYKPKYILADHKDFYYIVSESQQQWLDNEINGTAVAICLSKLAVVFPSDTYTHISVELVMMEDMGSQLNCAYFPDAESAQKWLYEEL